MNLRTKSQLSLALLAMALAGCTNKGLNSDKAAELIDAYEPFHTDTAPVPGVLSQKCQDVQHAYWSELSAAGFLTLSNVEIPAPKLPSFWQYGNKPTHRCVAQPTSKAHGHYQQVSGSPTSWKWFVGTRTVNQITNILIVEPNVAVVSFTYDTHRTDLAQSLILLMKEHNGKADIRRTNGSWQLVGVNVAGIQPPSLP